ncbi:hypothetical protein ATCV1_z124L [Acanthocystis turfacea chlorella virus 1]|uniref:Uncharacterized protein z124L n=1 Tax=Chlorovirus heliozoae TaxID=322019 RepID=A7K884_9PHYC|nr:hypothetical protein ATCV1_z124L [Acanthocystis turfacea chlorella virus 1]ABT16258.1 hypothetical protein ATCV1_z124L [Acanthocystis turfacea chlorella virus 1]
MDARESALRWLLWPSLMRLPSATAPQFIPNAVMLFCPTTSFSRSSSRHFSVTPFTEYRLCANSSGRRSSTIHTERSEPAFSRRRAARSRGSRRSPWWVLCAANTVGILSMRGLKYVSATSKCSLRNPRLHCPWWRTLGLSSVYTRRRRSWRFFRNSRGSSPGLHMLTRTVAFSGMLFMFVKPFSRLNLPPFSPSRPRIVPSCHSSRANDRWEYMRRAANRSAVALGVKWKM